MMHFTDLTGLVGIAFAIIALTLRLSVFARLRVRHKIVLAISLLLVMAIPFGGLSVVEFMRGVLGDLSITTLLLSLVLLPFFAGAEGARHVTRANKNSLLVFIVLAALALYPFALGVGIFDPYRLGFGNLWLIAVLLVVALGAWFLQYTLIVLVISLAALAWSIGWYESNNLWNYLLDPWVSVYALVVLLKKVISFALRLKTS